MGVYIKGMEMPGKGEYHMTLYVCSDGSAYIDVASFPVDEDRFELVPVPPHGRLKDADALEDMDFETCDTSDWYPIKERVAGKNHMRRIIKDAPTIIPADEETED